MEKKEKIFFIFPISFTYENVQLDFQIIKLEP
jgi:hypothetical protein